MSLKKKTLWGVIWNSLSSVSLTSLNFIITAILARLLTPNAFGIMGMIQTTIALINMMNEFGLAPAVIQGENLDQEKLSSLFWFNILVGIIMTSIVYFNSGIISIFFNQPELAKLLKYISAVFLIVSISFIHKSLLKKEMNFKKLFNINIISTIFYGLITIVLALSGLGVKSLVFGYISKNIIVTILTLLFYKWHPSLIFKLSSIKNLLKFGAYIFGSSIFNYFNHNLDYLLIGKFLGPEALGYYTLAYRIMLVPVQKIGGIINNTFLPVFSKIKQNKRAIKKYYLQVLTFIALITFPMMGGLFVTAKEFILSIYGKNWIPVILLIQILSISGALKSLSTTVGTILLSQGRSDISFKWGIFSVTNLLIAILIGINWGVIGIAYGVTTYTVYSFSIIMHITGDLVNIRLTEVFLNLKNPFIYTVFMMLGVYLTKKHVIYPSINNLSIQLILSIIAGIIIYIFINYIFGGEKYIEKFKELKNMM